VARHTPKGIPPKRKAPTVHDYACQAADGDMDAAYQVAIMGQPSSFKAMVKLVSPGLILTRAGFDASCDAYDIWVEKGRPTA
jgi:hypothetical protein